GGQVEFNIPGAGPFKIAPLTALPPLLRDTLIDGFTQPGAAPNTLTNGLNPTLLIELSGENTTNQAGLQWPGATGSPQVTVRGLCLNRWGKAISTGCQFCNSGVGLSPAPVIEGCFIGTDPTGTQARSNGVGIVFAEAFGGRIGGSTPAQRNLISGNAQAGISLEWDLSDSFLHNFTVQGNLIGTDRTGTNALGNGGPGIAAQATIPTTNSLIADNVICANGQGGMVVAGLGNSVLRNRIGVGVDGTTALGNAGAGLEVFGSQHQVGGANGVDANLIANNSGSGVHVGAGVGHSILGNSIFRNGGLAIDLGDPGATANDLGDGDGGPNNLQNKPALTNAIITGASEVVVSGSFNSASNSVYRLEFFHSPDFSPSNAPQARTFLGSTDLTTDGSGNARISVVTAVPSTDGFITATATDGANNTSEISVGARIGNGDFFEGVLPNLSIASGNGQSNSVNLFLEAPLAVRVTTTNGILLTSAPVTFTVTQGDATLAESMGASVRFPTLQVNTSGDGQAQVFCRLGQTAGITNLIRATVTSGVRSTNVIFAAVSLAAQREGVVLQGDPASPALDAMVNLRPVGVGRNQIEDGVILTRLDVVLDPGATVGQVNAALGSIGGGIVTMRPGSPFTTVSIPAPANASGLPAVAQALGSAPGVLFAFVGRETRVQAFPFPDPTEIFALASTVHLLPTRFPAAWNATNLLAGCGGNRVKVLVVDHFRSSPPTTFNFANQILHSTLSDPAPDSNETQDHGYLVAATVGGLFDAIAPTGANPFCDCLDFRLVQTLGLTMAQCNQQFADNMPVGEFVVNMSKGFAGFCTNTCTPELVLRQVPSAIERAASALNWRGLTSGRWNDFLFAAAAGNDRDKDLAPIYAGMTLAAFKSEPIINSSTDILLTFAGDSSLWAPKGGFANFPDLTATPDEMQRLSVLLSRLPAGALEPAENVISVGSTTDGLVPEDLEEAPFSNTGPDVKAVGQHLQICPITPAGNECEDLAGTSFSSPQVAALASYLWLLSPDLRIRSPADTITAIRANARLNT
ncbi:MAG TPA: S8 family serine peptidase, partial [Methylomirabilota bacterium]|nr:S8 family serine peptidase [Methylomirabilota bacterium]